MTTFVRFAKNEFRATVIEYGLIAAAMGLALITGEFSSLAGQISSGS